ncbi:MAG: cation transporter [Methanomassiliicoccaceae archaeon]|nr:cation transporter [Methanomassiliicoccaceae archaeon]
MRMKHVYRIENLGCAACAAKMETAINKIEGVASARIVFMTQRLTFEAEGSEMERIEPAIEKAVKKIEPYVKLRRG